jgi:hypothetical protein
MDPRFLEALPPNISALVKRIEAYSGVAIQVEQYDRDVPACAVDESEAKVCFPDLDSIKPREMLHELLHIERNWPEMVPQLFTTNEESEPHVTLIGKIDNALEHLVIVPREKDYGFEPFGPWNEKIGPKWQQRFWSKIEGADDRRLNLLLSWLSVDFLVTDQTIRALAQEALRETGLLDEAQNFSSAMRQVLDRKEFMAATAVRFLQLPPKSVGLYLFDVRAGKCIRFAVRN